MIKKNIPNILSTIRLLLAFVSAYLFYKESNLVASILYGVAGVTDIIDGAVARKYNLTSMFGKIVDPLADKLLVGLGMLVLCIKKCIPLFVLLCYVGVGVLMLIGFMYLDKRHSFVGVSIKFGKLAAVVVYFTVGISELISGWIFSGDLTMKLTTIITSVGVLFAIASMVCYFFYYFVDKKTSVIKSEKTDAADNMQHID